MSSSSSTQPPRVFFAFLLPVLLNALECGRVQVSTTLANGNGAKNPSVRILGGALATNGQWPWQVAIDYRSQADANRTYFCGGTLISSNYVLTAAHCTIDMIAGNSTITLGTTKRAGSDGQRAGIASIHTHPNFTGNDAEISFDIAVIKLSSTVSLTSYIQPICLPNRTIASAVVNTSYVSGWGRYTNGSGNQISTETSANLLYTQVPLIDLWDCNIKWDSASNNEISIRYDQICAGAFGHGLASGDSGGPLQAQDSNGQWFQLGICSWGAAADAYLIDQATYPGVYTNVTAFCEFISSSTSDEVECQQANLTWPATTQQGNTNTQPTAMPPTTTPSAGDLAGGVLSMLAILLLLTF